MSAAVQSRGRVASSPARASGRAEVKVEAVPDERAQENAPLTLEKPQKQKRPKITILQIHSVGYEHLSIAKSVIEDERGTTIESLKAIRGNIFDTVLTKRGGKPDPNLFLDVSSWKVTRGDHCGHNVAQIKEVLDNYKKPLLECVRRAEEFVATNGDNGQCLNIVVVDQHGIYASVTVATCVAALMRSKMYRAYKTKHVHRKYWPCNGDCDVCVKTPESASAKLLQRVIGFLTYA
jgi:hypothetical protein